MGRNSSRRGKVGRAVDGRARRALDGKVGAVPCRLKSRIYKQGGRGKQQGRRREVHDDRFLKISACHLFSG